MSRITVADSNDHNTGYGGQEALEDQIHEGLVCFQRVYQIPLHTWGLTLLSKPISQKLYQNTSTRKKNRDYRDVIEKFPCPDRLDRNIKTIGCVVDYESSVRFTNPLFILSYVPQFE